MASMDLKQLKYVFVFHDGENTFIPPTVRDGSKLYSRTLETAITALGGDPSTVNFLRLVVDWRIFLPQVAFAHASYYPNAATKSALIVSRLM